MAALVLAILVGDKFTGKEGFMYLHTYMVYTVRTNTLFGTASPTTYCLPSPAARQSHRGGSGISPAPSQITNKEILKLTVFKESLYYCCPPPPTPHHPQSSYGWSIYCWSIYCPPPPTPTVILWLVYLLPLLLLLLLRRQTHFETSFGMATGGWSNMAACSLLRSFLMLCVLSARAFIRSCIRVKS